LCVGLSASVAMFAKVEGSTTGRQRCVRAGELPIRISRIASTTASRSRDGCPEGKTARWTRPTGRVHPRRRRLSKRKSLRRPDHDLFGLARWQSAEPGPPWTLTSLQPCPEATRRHRDLPKSLARDSLRFLPNVQGPSLLNPPLDIVWLPRPANRWSSVSVARSVVVRAMFRAHGGTSWLLGQ